MRTPFSLALVIAAAVSVGACKQSGSGTAAPAMAQSATTGSGVPDQLRGGSTPADAKTFTGTVAETMNSGGYTYARLQAGGRDDVWIAAPEFDAQIGERLSASLEMPMQNFESRTLHRTFPLVYFVAEIARGGGSLVKTPQGAPPALMASHGASGAGSPGPTVAQIDPPPGGLSIADVFAKRSSLSGRAVTVRGTVVKINNGILDRNWIHIQDGSGSSSSNDNDLTITSDGQAQVGDVITASGVLGTNRDFGAGYAYDAILEKAAIGK